MYVKFQLKRKFELMDAINITVLLLLAALFVWLGMRYIQMFGSFDMKDMAGSAAQLREFIQGYGHAGVLLLVLLHVMQVIVSFIPSVMAQFIGGMLYGMSIGMITGLVGIFIGTVSSFYLSRKLGRRVVTLLVSEKNMRKLEDLLSHNISFVVLFILFVLPTPKDLFAYFIGLTNMKASRFFLIAMVGRLPGMLIATYLGAHIFDENYVLIIVVSALACAVSLVLVLNRNRIMKALSEKK